MPFPVVVGGVVRHVIYCTIPGQVSTNKRDYQVTSISGGSVLASTDILAQLDGAYETLFKNCMSFRATYYGSQLYYQTPTGPRPRPDSTTANQGIGSDAGDLLPTQSAGLISLYSDVLGKSGQGRIYVPFPAQDSIDSLGTPDALYLVDLTALRGTLIGTHTITSGGATGVLTPVLYIPGGSPPKPLVKGIVRDAFATQRRRGAFGRLNPNPF